MNLAAVAAAALSALAIHPTIVARHVKHRLPTAQASWFNDEESLACGEGGRAHFGIADRTLPCGTHVLLCHTGRCVRATVEDRGPYIYSRLFDLNANTKAAISCPDLCTVAYRIG